MGFIWQSLCQAEGSLTALLPESKVPQAGCRASAQPEFADGQAEFSSTAMLEGQFE